MSERAASLGRLTGKLMDLRALANHKVNTIEGRGYRATNEEISEISSKIDEFYEDIGGLCEHILTLPEPDTGVDEEDEAVL